MAVGWLDGRCYVAVMAVRIDDPGDVRLAEYSGIRTRPRRGWFVVESALAVERLLSSPYPVRSLLLSPAAHERLAPLLTGVAAPVYLADADVMSQVVGFDVHRGVLASATRLPEPQLADVLGAARLVVVLEGSNDLENIGAIARSAHALGADALLVDPTTADPFGRRCIRVSMGEMLHLPVVRCASWPRDLARLTDAGFETWALTPGADADPLGSLAVPPRVALLAGAEGPGLTPSAISSATRRVRIPLRPGVDSLNIGHAMAVALAHVSPYERPT